MLTAPGPDETLRLAEAWRAQFQATAAALSAEGRHPLPMMIGAIVAIARLVDIVASGGPVAGDALAENLIRDFRLAVLSMRQAPPANLN